MRRVLHTALHNPVNRWFLRRLRTPEPGEVYLHHGRVFVLPTKAGWGCGVLLAAMFAGAINYNLGLGFALTFLLGACAMVDMHLAFRNLAHLHLSAGRVLPVFAGEEAQFTLHVANRRKHARYAIWAGFVDEEPIGVEKPIDIAAHASASLTLSLPAAQHGCMPTPRVCLQTRLRLGRLRAWTYWRPDARAMVYPYPEPDDPPLPPSMRGQTDDQGPAEEQELVGIRPNQIGDSPRRQDW